MEHSIKVDYGVDVCKVIFDNLDIRARKVGITISPFYGTEATYEFIHALCTQRHDMKVVIIPANQDNTDFILLPEDTLGLYLYDTVPANVSNNYDVWVTVREGGLIFKNNLPPIDNNYVFSDRLKNTVERVADVTKSDGEMNVLFSHKSMLLRKPDDWWIEFPENTDKNMMTITLLKYIQDNKQMFSIVILAAKERIGTNAFGIGTILEFTEYPNIKVTMSDGPHGKFVRIKVGAVYFFFSVDRAIMSDWYQLMIKQLEAQGRVI